MGALLLVFCHCFGRTCCSLAQGPQGRRLAFGRSQEADEAVEGHARFPIDERRAVSREWQCRYHRCKPCERAGQPVRFHAEDSPRISSNALSSMGIQRHQTRSLSFSNHRQQLVLRSSREVEFLSTGGFDFNRKAAITTKRYQVSASLHAGTCCPNHEKRSCFHAPHALLFFGRATLRDGVDALVGASKHLPEFTLVSARHAKTSLSIVLDNFGVDAGRQWSSLHGFQRRPIG